MLLTYHLINLELAEFDEDLCRLVIDFLYETTNRKLFKNRIKEEFNNRYGLSGSNMSNAEYNFFKKLFQRFNMSLK